MHGFGNFVTVALSKVHLHVWCNVYILDKTTGCLTVDDVCIYCRNNEIKRFGPEDLPIEMESLEVLDLSDNKLQCDCKMNWISKQEWDIKHKTIIMK